MSNPYTMPSQPLVRTAPKWARKRYVLPAMGLAFFVGIGAGASGQHNGADAKPASDKVQPAATVTVTATATETAAAKPAPTITATKTVKVKVTVTAHAAAVDSGSSGGSSGGSSDGGSSSSGSDAGNGATAMCNDGTYSFAAHHQGACSHHGGVAVFYK
ncbi:DUF3761 domain-containing protein [Streptomyces beihaiensis]|uniref:DUF3761 domain-containing protein n=1 Tax=Streptomyces beihaiensis TaxID=2984495 RepID=A0ABT3TT17_9ACTN|nr:DUF3761 domain-containing protein [Streptomyces beihaiensis]MCX3059562.1 DUF3761 domain-containing protein [Streptomyces beihaiensis]